MDVMRAGEWQLDSFRATNDGWLARATVEQNPAGDAVLALIDEDNGAFSSGALPQRVKVRKSDGYVEEWPIVEGSVATRDGVLSIRGTTTARHVRALLSDLEEVSLSDDVQLVRSIWVMNAIVSANGASVSPAAAAPAPAPANQNPPPAPSNLLTDAQLDALVDRAIARRDAEQPTRSLAPGANPLPATPSIQVFSKYDHLSMLAQCLVYHARQFNNPVWRPEDEFIRSLGAKVERQYRQENEHVGDLGMGVRAIDPTAHETWSKYMGAAFRATELMTSTGAGYGDELVPTLMSSVAWYAFRLESRVLGLLQTFPMPSNPFTMPVISGGPTIRRVSEPTDQSSATIAASVIPASKPTTALKTWSAGMIGALVLASKILFEDAGLDVAEVMAKQLSMNMGQGIDSVLINGDEDSGATNISHHGAAIGATTYNSYIILDGLRDQAFANTDTYDAGALGIDDLTEVQKLMGARGNLGLDLSNLVILCDPGVYYKLKVLPEYRTYDKAGDAATILTGQVGHWDSIPVIVSDEMENTDATQVGKMVSTHDGTEGNFLVVNRQIPRVGFMRQIEIESSKVPHTDLFATSGTVRLDVQFLQAGGVGYGIGITV